MGQLSSEDVLRSVESRVLWLAVRMIDYANRERASDDRLKVGGHQASSASLATVMTVLWMDELQPYDRVSVKPHASPVLHALEYLLGWVGDEYLLTLRDFGGFQAYPSRTKDPVPVDYATGSVGLGAAAPLFGALVQRYVADHGHLGRQLGRFISIIGDAELDEGNVWEAVLDPATRGLGEAVWVVDLNRQSLDRVIPIIRASSLQRQFESAGWRVVELKYGRRLRSAFREPGGELLRHRIDSMANQEYQALFSATEAEVVAALERPYRLGDRQALRHLLDVHSDGVASLIHDLGGHDIADLRQAFAATRAAREPTVIFAYTIKGYNLPIAGHPMNHSAMLSAAQVDALRNAVGLSSDDEWSRFRAGTAAAELCALAATRLGPPSRVSPPRLGIAVGLEAASPLRAASTQEAFGRVMTDLGREPLTSERLVTAAPDVAVSTNLGGWINRMGIYGSKDEPSVEGDALRWMVAPKGQHIELGISEMNLFLLLSQLGLAHEYAGYALAPIGTLYDPFICRGLDALVYALYNGARFIVVGTPSGVSLSREGGAHQSTITPSIGLELPGITYAEPAYPAEVDWLIRHYIDMILNDCDQAESLYLRLSTKPVNEEPLSMVRRVRGDAAVRADVLAGGYRLAEVGTEARADVTLVACGAMIPEALAARDILHSDEGINASVIALTSPDRVYRTHRERVAKRISHPAARRRTTHLETLLRPDASVPIVSIIDGASHTLAFLGSAVGRRQICLGVDQFGQSGSLSAVYDFFELSPDAIAAAAVAVIVDDLDSA